MAKKVKTTAKVSRLGWNDLFMKGSVVDLTTSLWRARIKVKAQDLGIPDSEEVAQALSLGQHRLAPADAFEEIMEPARKAARAIDYYSLPFGLIPGARFVPDGNMPALLTRLREYKSQFNVAVEAFIDSYDEIKGEQLPVIEQALIDAAKTPADAARAFDRVQSEYPDKHEVQAKFNLRWSVYSISTTKSRAAADALAGETDEVKDVIREMVSQLRGEMTAKLSKILELANKGGKVNKRTLESCMELLDRIENLNILGDEVLAAQVAALRNYLTDVDRTKVDAGFITGLNDIQQTLETSIEDAIAAAESNLTGVGRRKMAVGE